MLSTLFPLFLNNLLPTFLIAGAGYLVGRTLQVKPRTFSQVTFYLFSPCLIFNLFTKNQLSSRDILQMMGYALAIIATMGALTWLLGKALRLPRRLLAAVLLSTMFLNAGNLGLPVTLFAFGETTLAYASLFYIAMALLMSTTGVIVASLGSTGPRQAILNLLRVPGTYALLLALLVTNFGWQVPLPLARTAELLGNAAIPSMLILLGLQLQYVRGAQQIPALTLAVGLRMLAAPVVAIGVSGLFGLQGPARQAGILQACMPTAVLATVLATEFDAEPTFVTMVVFANTLLSPLLLTPLLAYLGA